ncbi:MAG TPA: tetratricopeptide repeat protein [Rhizomicrobium sp.]
MSDGRAESGDSDTKQRLAHLKAAIEKDPARDTHWLTYCEALSACGELATARAVLQASQAHGVRSPALTSLGARLQTMTEAGRLHADGIRSHQQHELAKAVNLYRKALDLHPNFPEAQVNLGSALLTLGQPDDAIAQFSNAIALKPDFAAAHYNLGNALASSGRDPIEAYRAAIAFRPDYAEAHYNLGLALELAGRAEEAEQAYRSARVIDPAFVEAQVNLGVLLYSTGRLEEAISAYDAALTVRPDFVAAHCNRGNALRAQGALDAAAAAYQSAIAGDPSFAEGYNHLGNVRRAQGRLHEAADWYRQAMAMAPNFAEASYNLGYVLMECDAIVEGFSWLTHHARQVCSPGQPRDMPAFKHQHDTEQRAYLGPKKADPSGPLWLEGGETVPAPAVRRHPEIQSQWRGDHPLVVIDDFLSQDALTELRRFCRGSTIWREVYAGGYLGAFPEHGVACPLLAQIGEELKASYPEIFGDHPLLQIWAFKYSSQLRGIPLHADFAAVNVNFWITPDEANLNRAHGGLVIWDKPAPLDWDFAKYNIDADAGRTFLEAQGAKSITVPYRANRAVIFDSDLFHETDTIEFADGYCNRRINLTLLYGKRGP